MTKEDYIKYSTILLKELHPICVGLVFKNGKLIPKANLVDVSIESSGFYVTFVFKTKDPVTNKIISTYETQTDLYEFILDIDDFGGLREHLNSLVRRNLTYLQTGINKSSESFILAR